jgi:predicted TIM-barrel fold metal-dependent hydrolase
MYSTPGPAGVYRADAMNDKHVGGADPEQMRQQLLDDANVDVAILWPLACRHVADPEDEATVAAALNTWMADTWLSADNRHGRYRGTIVVSGRNVPRAVEEVEKWGGDSRFVQVGFDPIGVPPLGGSAMEPIARAADQYGLPISMHFITSPSMNVLTPVGFFAYASEFRILFPFAYAGHVISAITSGLFDRYPSLRVVCIEAGISWIVPMMWRVENLWSVLGGRCQRSAQEYLRENLRFTTQPLEEPDNLKHLHKLLEWAGADRSVMFSTDYPHFDFDHPSQVERRMPPAVRSRIMSENAIETYRLSRMRPAVGGRG